MGHTQHRVLADLHRVGPFRANHLPGIALGQPGIGAFLLPVVVNALAKDAEFVADAVANGPQLEAGQRFLEARRQPTQSTIPEPWFGLAAQQQLQIQAKLLAGRFGFLP